MNKWKQYLAWSRSHPFTFAFIVLLAAGCGIVAAAESWPLGLAFLVLTYFLWWVVYAIDAKRLIAVALAASLLFAAPSARSAPLIVGGIVVIVAAGLGYVGCKAVKKCNRIAKSATNRFNDDEMLFHVAAEPGESAAYFGWASEDYCWAERQLPVEPTVFKLSIHAVSSSNVTTTVTAANGYDLTQTFTEFQAEMAAHGLTISGSPMATESYARNLQPCSADEVPISFDRQTQTVTVSGGGILLVVERSDDLQRWAPLMRVNVAPGAKLEVEDTTSEASQFYRVLSCAPGGCAD